ncbi:hypothetical protein UP10_14525 [Bradyrhizobium sp. LTSPM299]|uniref:PC4/YdbC family ssDNA-binding protein n=1 Tax=Bradyrhizobium sp. LTSPM299 TaxID=1619233 RepID=UPI0005C956C1|nr:PC4/YdbC family ssDNA-binding protein [Bradyrhizobium sp. LTSPM299]KJC59907.1 hypothetical protein UP10_14525 [Bradyrhizobium sp. LTSPM299]
MTDKPTLAEPVTIGKMWKSPRDRKRTIVFAIKQYEGHTFLDCRLFDTNTEGQSVPTTKGVTIGMAQLTEFAANVGKSIAKARELGLIKPGPKLNTDEEFNSRPSHGGGE